jgi:glycosyltransferase involved in cell wall biosynthesis
MDHTRSAGDPEVSVIIPAYNTARLIGTALHSVLAQTTGGYEIIVVNDGSPDTPALERALEPFRDRIRYLVQQNGGISAARNNGIRASRGRYVAFLDSDDAWEPEYLEVQLAAMKADPGLALVYPNARIVGDHPHAGRTFMDVCPSKGAVTFESVLTQGCTVFVSLLAKRDVLLQVGLFDEDLRSVEDFCLWLKVLAAGHRIGYHRRVLVQHLKRRGSLSSDTIWMAETVLKVLDKVDRELALSPAHRAAVHARQAYFRARLELALGKRAFFRLDTPRALAHLERANDYFRSRRLRMVCALMRVSPGVLLRLYRLRDRLLVGADTSF